MNDPRWIRSANLSRRYIGIGDRPGQLYRDLDYLTGLRSHVERSFLRRSPARVLDAGPVSQPDVSAAVADLRDSATSDVRGLLLWTGYYKETWLVGPIVDGAGKHFVKVFKTAETAQAEVDRIALLARVLPDGVALTSLESRRSCVVSYELVQRSKQRVSWPVLIDTALRLGDRAAQESAVGGARALESRSHVEVLETLGGADGVPWLQDLLDQSAAVPRAIAHGDVTPWNVLVAARGPVLIDYERVDTYPIYYDAVHCLVQTAVEGGRRPDLRRVERILEQHGVSSARGVTAAAVLSNLVGTLDDYASNPGNRARTSRSIELKLESLRAYT